MMICRGGALLVLLVTTCSTLAKAKNMNDAEYLISNGLTGGANEYQTEYTSEFFEVYTPFIRSRYSEVFWTSMDPVTLPAEIIERFHNKTMAVVGYEVNQVRAGENGEDIPVPITHAYNHHYGAYLQNSKKGRIVKKTLTPEELAMHTDQPHPGMSHGTDHYFTFEYYDEKDKDENNGADKAPATVFSEANGGEMRLSYHGYPKGYAQLVHSPDQFVGYPMQIDTWNRDAGDTPEFHPGPLPKISPVHGDESAIYSGLVECPCSTRRQRHWQQDYKMTDVRESSACPKDAIEDASECWAGAQYVLPTVARIEHQTYNGDKTKPIGCSLSQRADGVLQVVWNEPSGDDDYVIVGKNAKSVVAFGTNAINATIALEESQATLTLVGPADKWFGMGFGSTTMCRHQEADECQDGGPYAVIIYNDTYIEERYLDFHGKGKVLPATVKVVTNMVEGGNRTVVLTRSLDGPDERYFSFDVNAPKLDVIMARGCNDTFAQHCGHGTTSLNFLSVDTPMRICRNGIHGGIDGGSFNEERCSDFPTGSLKLSNNPTCSIKTYVGGLDCCKHGQSLLDADQEIPWPDQILEYRLKFRFYFEDYVPVVPETQKPSHHNLARFYWQTECCAGEYDVTPCPPGTPPSQCVHEITSHFQVSQMLIDSSWDNTWTTGPGSKDAAGIELINAMPHCHAPSCLSMELYNADTGELLCHVEPRHGTSTDKVFDELGFLAIPPCLWSHNSDDGLMEPVFLSRDTMLLSIKRNNNTIAHTGEMASWQMRGLVIMHRENEKEYAEVVNKVAKTVEHGDKVSDKSSATRTTVRKGRPEV